MEAQIFFFWHFFPVISPCAVFLLKLVVGMGKKPIPSGADLVSALAWGFLSFAIWTMTVSHAQKKLICSGGILKGTDGHNAVERGCSIVLLMLVILTCGMTVSADSTLVVFVVIAGCFGTSVAYLAFGWRKLGRRICEERKIK